METTTAEASKFFNRARNKNSTQLYFSKSPQNHMIDLFYFKSNQHLLDRGRKSYNQTSPILEKQRALSSVSPRNEKLTQIYHRLRVTQNRKLILTQKNKSQNHKDFRNIVLTSGSRLGHQPFFDEPCDKKPVEFPPVSDQHYSFGIMA